MTETAGRRLHAGVLPGVVALLLAASTATILATSNWTGDDVTGRFAIAGVVLFAIALAFGSARFVGLASLPVLGSALFSSASADDPAWIRSIVVGCLWYVAVELAWDSIERRNGVKRSPTLEFRRMNEVASIAVIALVMNLIAYAASTGDVSRTLVGQAVIVVALLIALVFAIRHLKETSPLELSGFAKVREPKSEEE